MNKQQAYHVVLLTPSFCHGADPNGDGELRVASIRGHIREWRRMRGREYHAVEEVWGGTNGSKMLASKVALELVDVQNANSQPTPLLPHKNGPKRGAVRQGAAFTLVLRRLVGCTDELSKEAKRDVETWLLLGCLGQRSNRAAGSVWCTDWPMNTVDDFRQRLRKLTVPPSWDIRISRQTMTAEKARETASDTKDGSPHLFGSIKPRKPSPTKMKVVRIGGDCRLLLFAARPGILDQALRELRNKPDSARWRDLQFDSVT